MSTLLVYSNVNDAHINSFDPTYAGAQSGGATTFSAVTSGAFLVAGQDLQAGSYRIREAFLAFDTSLIPGLPAAVVSAQLTIATDATSSGNGAVLEVRLHAWTDPITTAQWVVPTTTASDTLVATMVGPGGSSVTTSLPALLTSLNTAGFTQLIVVSTDMRTGTTPLASSTYYIINGAETAGTSLDPVLTLTLNIADGFITSYKQHPKPLLNMRARGLR